MFQTVVAAVVAAPDYDLKESLGLFGRDPPLAVASASSNAGFLVQHVHFVRPRNTLEGFVSCLRMNMQDVCNMLLKMATLQAINILAQPCQFDTCRCLCHFPPQDMCFSYMQTVAKVSYFCTTLSLCVRG